MIDEEIKKLIKKVENLLKSDERFVRNGDHLYKKHMKKINKEMKRGITNIPIIQPPINMMLPKVVVREVPKVVTKEVIRLVPHCPKEDIPPLPLRSISSDTGTGLSTSRDIPPLPLRSISSDTGTGLSTSRDTKIDDMNEIYDDINSLIGQYNLDALNKRLLDMNQKLEQLVKDYSN
jgi:hypothetical protein